jgi:hypothetical protein
MNCGAIVGTRTSISLSIDGSLFADVWALRTTGTVLLFPGEPLVRILRHRRVLSDSGKTLIFRVAGIFTWK